MISSIAPIAGRKAVVLPQGALFRGGVGVKIRRKLLEMDLIEAVIGLAPNLFYSTGLAASIMDSEHLPLCTTAHLRGYPPGARGYRGFQSSLCNGPRCGR
jgi:hypothetical protein